MSITLGYGGGDTQSKVNANANTKPAGGGTSGSGMSGGALGIGAKLSADAVIVIDKDNVLMAPIGAQGGMGQMLNKIPQIIIQKYCKEGQEKPDIRIQQAYLPQYIIRLVGIIPDMQLQP
jgi:uncharacterized spore protein YtfJ